MPTSSRYDLVTPELGATDYPATITQLAEDIGNIGTAAKPFLDLITEGPWVDIRKYTSDLVAALADIGSNVVTLLIPSNVQIAPEITVPPNVHLSFIGAGRFTDAGGILIINGTFFAPERKIFFGFARGDIRYDVGYTNAVPRKADPIHWGINDGTNNDHIAINCAVSAGSRVLLKGRQYVLSGNITVPHVDINGGNKFIKGDGATLVAAANNLKLLHWSDSHGGTSDLIFNGNGFTGLRGFSLTPELENANIAVVNQNHNRFHNHRYINLDEGEVLMAGIPHGATASGCWYNRFTGSRVFTSVRRCRLFKDNGSLDPISSGANSNYLEVSFMGGTVNTGNEIQAGGGNVFLISNYEQINHVPASGFIPNAVPTALIVKQFMANGGGNPDNLFIEDHYEGVTRHSTVNEDSTKFLNTDMDLSLCNGTATIKTFIPKRTSATNSHLVAGFRSMMRDEGLRLDDRGNLMLSDKAFAGNGTGTNKLILSDGVEANAPDNCVQYGSVPFSAFGSIPEIQCFGDDVIIDGAGDQPATVRLRAKYQGRVFRILAVEEPP